MAPHRVATRTVMVLLSASGMNAAEIGALLHYHPRTVRRWLVPHAVEGITGVTGPATPGPPPIRQSPPGTTDPHTAGHTEGVDHRPGLA
jgi:Homeodomain-like domain-containing protein